MIRNVRDLKTYLRENNRSPEAVARDLGISHMTVRRLLERPASHAIAPKYWPLFDRLTGTAEPAVEIAEPLPLSGFEGIMDQVEKDGAACPDPEATRASALKKARQKEVGTGIFSLVRKLDRALRSKGPFRKRAIALGALLYFLNPIDLIPDNIPVVGYLDDFAVLTLAVRAIGQDTDGDDKKGPSLPKIVSPA